jgi:hypothetical protein
MYRQPMTVLVFHEQNDHRTAQIAKELDAGFTHEKALTLWLNKSPPPEGISSASQVAWYLGHPIWWMPTITQLPQNVDIALANRSHLASTHRTITPNNTVAYLPPAATRVLDHDCERDIDVLFVGTAMDCLQLEPMVQEASQWITTEPSYSLESIAQLVYAKNRTYLNPSAELQMMQRALYQAISTARAKIVASLLDLPCEVRIHGLNQPDGATTYQETLALMHRSKIFVCHTPDVGMDNTHLALDAALRGCWVVATPCPFLDSIGLRYTRIQPKQNWESVLQALKPELLQADIEQNQKIISRAHLWSHRAKHLENGRISI